MEFAKLVSASLEEGKRAMAEAEEDTRVRLEADEGGRQSRVLRPKLPAD